MDIRTSVRTHSTQKSSFAGADLTAREYATTLRQQLKQTDRVDFEHPLAPDASLEEVRHSGLNAADAAVAEARFTIPGETISVENVTRSYNRRANTIRKASNGMATAIGLGMVGGVALAALGKVPTLVAPVSLGVGLVGLGWNLTLGHQLASGLKEQGELVKMWGPAAANLHEA